ncbi:MAG: sulfatase, partial [Armatimonadota bacterium]
MRILYIDIDSLRPDHLGCYGYRNETGRDTSPNIDSIADEGVLFRECYTPDAPCLPSRTALYSGRFGIQTGVVGHGGTAAEPKVEGRNRAFRDRFDSQGLARQLQLRGLHTAMISPFGQRHAAHWFYAGFNEIHNTGKGGMESAEEVWPVIEQWLDTKASGDNWYLHINFWDPHTPYRAPKDAGEPFAGKFLPAWMEEGGQPLIDRLAAKTGPHSARDLYMYEGGEKAQFPRQPGEIVDIASLRRNIDGYDTGVWWADRHVGRIVERLKSLGIWEETAIIVSSDHGENQGELGIWGEHATADAGTCRIPMIVRWPGGRKGTEDNALRYNLDLAPTLMDLLEGKKQPLWDGESFAGAVTGAQPDSSRRDDIVIS